MLQKWSEKTLFFQWENIGKMNFINYDSTDCEANFESFQHVQGYFYLIKKVHSASVACSSLFLSFVRSFFFFFFVEIRDDYESFIQKATRERHSEGRFVLAHKRIDKSFGARERKTLSEDCQKLFEAVYIYRVGKPF